MTWMGINRFITSDDTKAFVFCFVIKTRPHELDQDSRLVKFSWSNVASVDSVNPAKDFGVICETCY